ncbi:TPA: cupin domain-containing protein [Klebsiella aerogenes]|uniref:Cupin domain-containing protein n=1 Tax=Klebsiella aerogenes TaxID=548 RepID=A0AAP9U6Y6_KLEAE|nr:cupin domain-containing protein [Klebsiella aerogenes]EIV2083590.1 cupin domain-containing protein [Klebsiella aerogenes]EIW9211831.1 cupin domain-containing protein [Klebsiella aerogenes]EKM7807681.1 cupin domain-containing protein [Klebsiella aerogenes]EKU4511617.1 cupin domain-containing protein [Klebsiella aerogenes]EKU6672260.1 cupin domain-containing protein [Klebsiella aerogenes]
MNKFEIFRKSNFDGLVHEYGLDGRRLLPWDNYPMPFAGGWCVVRPGTQSEPHTQIDQEIFIAIKGQATLIVGEEQYEFTTGDIAAIPKHTNHYIINDSTEDFHFYVVWWDMNYVNDFINQHNDTTGCLDV